MVRPDIWTIAENCFFVWICGKAGCGNSAVALVLVVAVTGCECSLMDDTPQPWHSKNSTQMALWRMVKGV